MNEAVLEKAYPAIVGALATLVAQAILRNVWKVATGEAPPDPHDPAVPVKEAVVWFVASSVGVGVAQLVAARYTRKQVATWRASA